MGAGSADASLGLGSPFARDTGAVLASGSERLSELERSSDLGATLLLAFYGLVFAVVGLAACGRYELAAKWNELRGDAYPLDAVSRDDAQR